MPIDDLIGAVPLFAALPDHARHELADIATRRHLDGGQYLFRQGDEPDGIAIVASGRLQVLKRDEATGDERVVGVLGRGGWVGELSLLTGLPRSASVRALRDCELLLVTRETFDALLADEPDLAVSMAQSLARQLQAAQTVAIDSSAPNTIGIVPLGAELPVERLTAALVVALEPWGPIDVHHGDPKSARVTLSPETDELRHRRWAEELDRLEEEWPLVILVADDPVADPQWAAFCARSTDRVLVLLRGGKPPAWALADGEAPVTHRDLVFVGSSLNATRMSAALDQLKPRGLHHLPEGEGFAWNAARIARRTTGHAPGLVLSGGGARGLAHLGVLQVLDERDITIDRVGGCSAGAVAAALHALGWSTGRMIRELREELVDHNPFTDFTVPRESLIRGRKAMAMLTRLFGEARIEELSLPLFIVSADLATGDLVVHQKGLIRDAVAASMAIPGFAPPVRYRDRSTDKEQLLVDGGLLDNFPVDVMRATHEGPIIGVDVMRDYPAATGEVESAPRWLRGDSAGPGIVTTLARSMVLGGWQRSQRNRDEADLLISPSVADIGLFDFDRLDDAIAAGRAATERALEDQGLPT